MPMQPSSVRFIVTYEDGSHDYMSVPAATLRSGDHVARVVAGEKQRAGELRRGEITGVRRDYSGG